MRGMRPVLVKRLIFCVDGQNRRSPSVALLVEGNVRVQLKAKRCAGKTMKEQHQCLQSFQFIPWRSFSSVPSFSMFHSWVIRYIVTLCAGVAVATPTSINRRGRELSAYIQAATPKILISNSSPPAVTDDVFSNLQLFEQYAAAAYCPTNGNSPGTKLTCVVGNCPRVQAANTTTVIEFEK